MEQSSVRSPSSTTSKSASLSEYAELFDAKITSIPDVARAELYQTQLEQDIGNQAIMNDRIQFHDFQRYRGIIDIDGHSWSGRFGSLLCLNSVILKVEPTYVEYFYARLPSRNNRRNHTNHIDDNDNDELQAWKHYIPIRADFSNLEEMAEYVIDPAHDDVLQYIVQNANAWCQQNMISSTITKDMLDVWDRYVELLNVNNIQWTEQHWTDDVQAAVLNDHHLNMVPLDLSDDLMQL
jgi:hypothetical protein